MQRSRAADGVTLRIGPAVKTDVPPGFGGQQVVLERPIVAAASDPDIAAPQTPAQRGQHPPFCRDAGPLRRPRRSACATARLKRAMYGRAGVEFIRARMMPL
jgi:hypothetical protein